MLDKYILIVLSLLWLATSGLFLFIVKRNTFDLEAEVSALQKSISQELVKYELLRSELCYLTRPARISALSATQKLRYHYADCIFTIDGAAKLIIVTD